jgi:hypothetical protein
MPLFFDAPRVHFDGYCEMQNAPALWRFLNTTPGAEVDLECCEGMHAALFQVLAALRPRVVAPPIDPRLGSLIEEVTGSAS